MRFSEYRAKAPVKDAVAPKVIAIVEQALSALGAERDPECWVVWGDDPAVRYLLFAPIPAGLVQVAVRVAVPGEGPRAGGKVMRWNRVQLGELAVEIQGGHHLVTFQIETQVLNGADAKADAITAFAQVLFAAVDGRVPPRLPAGKKPSGTRASATGGQAAGEGTAARAVEGILGLTGLKSLPGPTISPVRRTIRYWISRLVAAALTRAYLRVGLEGREHLPPGSAIYCFNHLSWADPFVLMAVLPMRPRLWFFGPKEEDMTTGGRNRLMSWTGTTIPYKPAKNDLLDATRRVGAVVASGAVVAIAGEGRIHARESDLLPLSEGAAYFALRSGIPLVPIVIGGTSWLRFGGHARVRVGEPIAIVGRPTRERVEEATAALTAALHGMLDGSPDLPRPGRFGRWLTERFNDWPEGSREAARAASEASALAYFDPPEST